MCEKCIRKTKRLGHKPLTYGQVKFYAHQFMTPIYSLRSGGCMYTPIPLFKNKGINYAIEAHMHKIQRKRTNKKIYNRKR